MTPPTFKTRFPKEIDTVMEEVHRVKAELAKCYNFDVKAMARGVRERQAQSGHPVVTRPPRASIQC